MNLRYPDTYAAGNACHSACSCFLLPLTKLEMVNNGSISGVLITENSRLVEERYVR